MLLILPLLCFALVFEALRRRCVGVRQAFLSAAVVWGLIVTTITEVLSLFNSLSVVSLAACWGAALIGTAFVALRRTKPASDALQLKPRWPTLEVLLLVAPIVPVALITGFIAIVGWPNNWDAMTYHLGRVAHWTQNGSVAFYPSHIIHQLFYPPWAEYAILHLTLLGGDERRANLVQWFSMFGSVVGVSLIAQRFGANRRGQLFSSLFCATLPLGILQASSAQNDYVTAFWLVCLANGLLALRKEPALTGHALSVGASLGLAIFTKGVAYLLAIPMLLLLVRPEAPTTSTRWLKQAALVVFVALAVNGPQYFRNVDVFGWVLGPLERGDQGTPHAGIGLTNEALSLPILVSNLVRNTTVHMGVPLRGVNLAMEEVVEGMHVRLGVDVSDPRTTRHGPFRIPPPEARDNSAGNPIHMLMIVASLLAIVLLRGLPFPTRIRGYGLALVLGFVMLSLLKWQPLHSRFQFPLFVLSASLVGLVLQRHPRLMAASAVAMIIWAWPFLVDNRAHPLLGEQNLLRTSRIDQYFRQGPGIRSEYIGAASFVQSTGCGQVGLILDWDDYEYPLWVLLPKLRDGGRLEHVAVNNSSARLAGRWPVFAPCAVIAVRGATRETLELNGRSYRRGWSSGTQADRVEVYVS